MNKLIIDFAYKPAFKSGQRPKNVKGKTAHTNPQFKRSLKIFDDDNKINSDTIENRVNE